MRNILKTLLIAIIVMATTSTTTVAQTIAFSNETNCEIKYDVDTLADIILNSYEPVDEEESAILMDEFDERFPGGPDELAWTLKVPDDAYFYAIYLQTTKRGRILKMFIHAEDGWLKADPGQSRALRHLAKKITR